MRIFIYLIGGLAVLIVAAGLYVRLAPSDPARWHQPVTAEADADLGNGAIRVRSAEPEALARFDSAARALPRTEVLAGSVEAGMITYVTRSALWRFPDYTTVQYADGTLRAFGRARFGASDLGVNRDRLEGLLAAAQL